ncbi:MAG: D-glycerate dehydrogenase [Planctomycetes bacterium]|nr:D-glycerate dehydrogenase [Planctomycetota bacterium]
MPGGTRPKVFVTRAFPASGLDKILDACDAEVWNDPLPPPREVLLEKVAGCDGVLTMLTETVDAEFMDTAGDELKVISNFAVGFNNIDVAEATKREIRIGNTPGVLTDATADMAVTLLLTAGRRIAEASQYVKAGNWKTWEPLGHIGVDLHERTLGIVGMGRIGYAVAKRCHGGWNMRVLYHDNIQNEQAEQNMGAKQVDLDTLLGESDVVSVHTDLNESTTGMFNATLFAKMKNTAVFINTARGPLHVPGDLYDALKNGEIFAAGLDVTNPEPIEMDDPLLTLSNCVIVPHIASATVSSRNGMAKIAADNLLAGLEGKPLRCWVNPEVRND